MQAEADDNMISSEATAIPPNEANPSQSRDSENGSSAQDPIKSEPAQIPQQRLNVLDEDEKEDIPDESMNESMKEWTRKSVDLQNRLIAMQQRAESGMQLVPQEFAVEVGSEVSDAVSSENPKLSNSEQKELLQERKSLEQRLSLIDSNLEWCEDTKKSIRKSFGSFIKQSIRNGDVDRAASMALMPNKKRLLDEDEQEMNQIESELLQERQSLVQRLSTIDADLEHHEQSKGLHDGTGISCQEANDELKRKNQAIREVHQLLVQATGRLELEMAKELKNDNPKARLIHENQGKPQNSPRKSNRLEKAKYVTEVKRSLSKKDWHRFKNLMNETKEFHQETDAQNVSPEDRQSFTNAVVREVKEIFKDNDHPRQSAQLMMDFEMLFPEEENAELFREKLGDLNPVRKSRNQQNPSTMRDRAKYVMEVRKVLSPKDWHSFKILMKELTEFHRDEDERAPNDEERKAFADGMARAMLHIFEDGNYSRDHDYLVHDFDQLIPNEDDAMLYYEQLEYNRKMHTLLKEANSENQEILRLESKLKSQGVEMIKIRVIPPDSTGPAQDADADLQRSQEAGFRKFGSLMKHSISGGDIKRVPSMAPIPRQQTIETKQYRNSLERKRAMMFLLDAPTESESVNSNS